MGDTRESMEATLNAAPRTPSRRRWIGSYKSRPLLQVVDVSVRPPL